MKTSFPETQNPPAAERLTSFRLVVRLLISALAAGLVVGIVSERYEGYAEILARGHRIPYADQIFMVVGALFMLALLVQTWFPQRFTALYRLRSKLGWVRWVIAPLPALAISWLMVFSEYSLRFDDFYSRLLLYGMAACLLVWMAARSQVQPLDWKTSLAGLVIFGCVFVLVNAMQVVVDFPFILSWSEGNRFYDYSVLFGRRLYDYPADQPLKAFIDIGRQTLWGLPFLFGDISIAMMRFWSQLLFTVPYILLGLAFLRRRVVGTAIFVLFGLWTMLFLNQGPIYTPLVLAAILVALSRRSPLWLALPVVLLAGYYARLARFTWLFAPAMWAVLIAFLEEGQPERGTRERWIRAAALGFAGVLGGYILPEILPWLSLETGISVVAVQIDLSSVSQMVERQPLLWDRLWPNETYAPGIVPGMLLATGPLLVLLGYALITRRWKLDLWQILYLGAMTLAFLVVGLVVSVKIGGGSNLHNLDMLLIGLLFTAGLFLEQGGKDWLRAPSSLPHWGKLLLLFLLVYPATLEMFSVRQRIFPEADRIQEVLAVTQKLISEKKTEGEVLFLDHRQLLTFGYIQDVPLVTDYEKKLLMEQAMQSQAGFFEGFYEDLASHRFSLIITEPLYTGLKEEDYHFGSENNAWVRWVSIPLLCYYEPVQTFPDVTLQMLVPKARSAPGPGLECP